MVWEFTSRVRTFSKSDTSPGPGRTIELPAGRSSVSRGTPLSWLIRERSNPSCTPFPAALARSEALLCTGPQPVGCQILTREQRHC